jgi:acetyl esterase/lipase
VLANVDGDFDNGKVVLSGFSAGATLALVASSVLGGNFGNVSHPVRGVVAFYPATDAVKLRRRARECSAPNYWSWSMAGGFTIPDFILSFFVRSYFRGYQGATLQQAQQSPVASPLYANASTFPRDIMLVTCEYDTLWDEGEAFRTKFRDSLNIRGKEIKSVAHSFDYYVRNPRERGWQERRQAYDEVTQFLHELWMGD